MCRTLIGWQEVEMIAGASEQGHIAPQNRIIKWPEAKRIIRRTLNEDQTQGILKSIKGDVYMNGSHHLETVDVGDLGEGLQLW
jgi:hypothetical protein